VTSYRADGSLDTFWLTAAQQPSASRPVILTLMEFVILKRDSRTLGMCFGTDENRYPRRLNQAVLGDIMARWATTTATPEGPCELLALDEDAAGGPPGSGAPGQPGVR
jgi:hypothetical protein